MKELVKIYLYGMVILGLEKTGLFFLPLLNS